MVWRSVVINRPAKLRREHFALVVEQEQCARVPFEDIAVIVLNHREITLTHPAPYLPQLLMHQTAYPVPRHVIEKHGDAWIRPENFVSNGPFRLVEWRPNDKVRVVKNERFHDAANVKLDEVAFYPTDDSEAALKRFRTGELDLNVGFPSQQIDFLRRSLADALHVTTLVNTRYIVMNTTRPPTETMSSVSWPASIVAHASLARTSVCSTWTM